MLNLRRIQWEYYKKGMFPEMHHIYRRYFPDVTPLPHTWGKGGEGGGGVITIIGKNGKTHTINKTNVKNPMGWVLWNETLGSDFTLDQIKFSTYYTKIQYWDIMYHNKKIHDSQSKFNQIMDALLTGLKQ